MESNRNFIIIMSIIGVIIVVLLIVFVASPDSSQDYGNQIGNEIVDNNEDDNPITNSIINEESQPNPEDDKDSISLSKLNSYDLFFSLASLVTDYYTSFTTQSYDKIMGLIDSEYRIKNNIRKDNVNKLVNAEQGEIMYSAKTIYVKENSKISYYFITGDTIQYISTEHSHDENTNENNESGSQIVEEENICYLIIHDKITNTYSITPLSITTDLYNYSQEYKIKNKTISSNDYNRFKKTTRDDEMIARNYISYFLTIMYINTEKAFNMLEPNYKNTFGNLQNFTNNLENINSKISTNFLGYNVSGESGNRTYVIQMRDNTKMTIIEEGIMNFKIKIS